MAIQLLGTNQIIPLTLEITTLAGDPSTVDGAPTWASSDETILTLDVAADGLSATANAVGVAGSATVTVTADSDLSAQVKQITGTLDFSVIEASQLAAVITIKAGTPTDKPQTGVSQPAFGITQAPQYGNKPAANRAASSQASVRPGYTNPVNPAKK